MMFFSRLGRFLVLGYILSRTTLQMLYGSWRIAKAPMPLISIFGSARIKDDSLYAQKAHELGMKLVQNGVSVLTGGGPGIMKAASCNLGTIEGKKQGMSIGIGVRGLQETPMICNSEYFELDYFFARKWLLTEFSAGFIVFPGGFGTLDEMAGVLTLIQTKRIEKRPVVLIGVEYWKPFVYWVRHEMIAHGAVLEQELEFFYVTDKLEDAYCWVLGQCEILK